MPLWRMSCLKEVRKTKGTKKNVWKLPSEDERIMDDPGRFGLKIDL